jgi:hypothetical protein
LYINWLSNSKKDAILAKLEIVCFLAGFLHLKKKERNIMMMQY